MVPAFSIHYGFVEIVKLRANPFQPRIIILVNRSGHL